MELRRSVSRNHLTVREKEWLLDSAVKSRSKSETMVRKIEPDFEAGAIGCHHMDARGGLVVMDVRKRVGGFGGRRP